MLSIFCDGSAHARAGLPGGWAFIVVRDGAALLTRAGAEKSATSNQMELRAALEGLREVTALGWEDEVELVCDSKFAIDIASGAYLPKKHLAEAKGLRAAALAAKATARWVPGHAGDQWNEEADALAHEAKQTLVPQRVKKKAARRAARK